MKSISGERDGWQELKERLEEIPLQRLDKLVRKCEIPLGPRFQARRSRKESAVRRKFIEVISKTDSLTLWKGFVRLWREEHPDFHPDTFGDIS